ncbi:hypothetical protein ACQKWADRAFT_232008 [Trichoderma austrokoningii]
MANNCGSRCPSENGLSTNDPCIGGSAVFLALYAFLTPVSFYQGYRFRTPGFSALLATGLCFEVLGFLGRMLLQGGRGHQGYFALALLGSVLGAAFMCSAMSIVLPHILAVFGDRHTACQSPFIALFPGALLIVSLVLNIIGIVFAAYGYGGVSRDRGADIIAGGLGAQAFLLLVISAVYACFIMHLRSEAEAPNPAHSYIYHSSRFSLFLRYMAMTAFLLFGHTIYRIFEMTGGIDGTLFQSEPAFMVMDALVPFLASLLLTVAHPGAAFGSSWASTSSWNYNRRGPSLSPMPTSFGYAIHHRYDPNIRQQFSPSTQRPLRKLKPPPIYGSYGLPSSPRPLNKPPTPTKLSPISTRAVNLERLSERLEKLVDNSELW